MFGSTWKAGSKFAFAFISYATSIFFKSYEPLALLGSILIFSLSNTDAYLLISKRTDLSGFHSALSKLLAGGAFICTIGSIVAMIILISNPNAQVVIDIFGYSKNIVVLDVLKSIKDAVVIFLGFYCIIPFIEFVIYGVKNWLKNKNKGFYLVDDNSYDSIKNIGGHK